jgi:hypothetical protein
MLQRVSESACRESTYGQGGECSCTSTDLRFATTTGSLRCASIQVSNRSLTPALGENTLIFDPFSSFLESIIKAWISRKMWMRAVIIGALFLAVSAIGVQLISSRGVLVRSGADAISATLGILAALSGFVVGAYQALQENRERQNKIEIVEERARDHPEKPQFAWDLARTKLESYLDRNLAQVRSIYWLTLLVMLCGFGFIVYGIYGAFQSPDRLPVSIVASASGVIVSFIGGSLLLIYRSILVQSKDYVTVLERINAVGMAVQVIASISESGQDLKNRTTADLAMQLLNLYANNRVNPQAST